MNDINHKNINFCLGLSKPLNIFDNEIRNIIRLALENKIFFHISISYPINFILLRFLTKQLKRNQIRFIAKILGDSEKNFLLSLNLTFGKFLIKKINIIQIINLPFNKKTERSVKNINKLELEKVHRQISILKNDKKIEKCYVQVNSNDNLDFCNFLLNYFDGFVFYSNKPNIYLDKEVYDLILRKKIPCIVLSIFGNTMNAKVNYKNHHLINFQFIIDFFPQNTIGIGRTTKYNRLKELILFNNYKENKNLNINPIFEKFNEKQETSEDFFKRYKVTNFIYILIFIFKCFSKKIIGQKTWLYLKNIYKKNYEN